MRIRNQSKEVFLEEKLSQLLRESLLRKENPLQILESLLPEDELSQFLTEDVQEWLRAGDPSNQDLADDAASQLLFQSLRLSSLAQNPHVRKWLRNPEARFRDLVESAAIQRT